LRFNFFDFLKKSLVSQKETMELNLLMIDDHAAIIEGYKAILSLSKKKYVLNITTASDCESAYKVITKHHDIAFDVVFVDITLPPYEEKKLHSGVDVVTLIRAICHRLK